MHDKLLEKFHTYWLNPQSEESARIRFSKDEIHKLLRHFSQAVADDQYYKTLKLALRLYPEEEDFKIRTVDFLLRTGKEEKARQTMRRWGLEQSDSPAARFLQAKIHNRRHRADRALAILKELEPVYPRKQELYAETALALYRLRQWEGAFRYYEKFIRAKIGELKHLHPVKKRMSLVSDLEKLMRYAVRILPPAGRIALMEKLILLDESNPDLWLALADVYRTHGRMQQALRACQQAQLLDPGYLAAYYKKAEILESSLSPLHKTEAIKEYLKSLQLAPSAYVNYKIAGIFRRLQHPELAEVYYENALYEDPVYVPAWMDLILTLEMSGQGRKAEQKIKEALERVNSKRLYELAGDIYALHGKLREALEAYLHASGIEPPSRIRTKIAMLRKAMENPEEGMEALYPLYRMIHAQRNEIKN
ncbi:MAG: hypothetical protein GXO27_01470 [Chlorobi bacterium]|nr:hypothetical protein [Chlorobiota bacterium]